MQKFLSEIRLISQKNSLLSYAKPETRAKLITLAGKLRELNQDLAINMEVGFSNNRHGNLRSKLSDKLTKFNSVVDLLTAQLDKLINPTALVEYYAYLDGSDRVLDSSFELWDETSKELDFLLHKRIESFITEKILISVLVLITLLIVIYLFVAFYRSVMQTVFVLDEASKKMASGNVDHKIILDNRDELGQLVAAFNKIADALVAANQ
ncbi:MULTISPECIES: HAMP domain-containing protein [unclassified Microcoleus]|uniref:HAMP domain-containing protein n=1 Tax=unclassified Microcoleus TaxID=2642155 RepID=UPI00403F9E3A